MEIEIPGYPEWRWLRSNEEVSSGVRWFDVDVGGTSFVQTVVKRSENMYCMGIPAMVDAHNSRGREWPSDAHGLCGLVVRKKAPEVKREKTKLANLRVILMADDMVIAESDDFKVWSQTFDVIRKEAKEEDAPERKRNVDAEVSVDDLMTSQPFHVYPKSADFSDGNKFLEDLDSVGERRPGEIQKYAGVLVREK